MDEAEIEALLDVIEVWDRRHDAVPWACADVFGGVACYRLDPETLVTVRQR